MSKEIFISYSRRDQEFVTRLASDLDAQVAGVWFDQSAIQIGENWHDEIMEGIRDCKAFILVLSPDAMESRYVREEVHRALELNKTIFPILYRPAKWNDEIETIVREIQTLDLRSGSYTDNFYKLVDGLIESGAARPDSYQRPFLRQPTMPGLKAVFSKAFGWALAWSLGWVVFWALIFIFLFLLILLQNRAGPEDFLNFLAFLASGMAGGFAGGLVAGFVSMLILRPYVPSITWKHMSPTVRAWAISGPLGMIAATLITAITLSVIGITTTTSSGCRGLGLSECLGQIFGAALGVTFAIIMVSLVTFMLSVILLWFLTGMFTGWQVVRHIRRLEPGITRGQGWRVSAGWGCGAIVAAVVMVLVLWVITITLGL